MTSSEQFLLDDSARPRSDATPRGALGAAQLVWGDIKAGQYEVTPKMMDALFKAVATYSPGSAGRRAALAILRDAYAVRHDQLRELTDSIKRDKQEAQKAREADAKREAKRARTAAKLAEKQGEMAVVEDEPASSFTFTVPGSSGTSLSAEVAALSTR